MDDKARREHKRWCDAWGPNVCSINLPAEGERLTFGVHRLCRREAQLARAWPSIASHHSRLTRAADRIADKAVRRLAARAWRAAGSSNAR